MSDNEVWSQLTGLPIATVEHVEAGVYLAVDWDDVADLRGNYTFNAEAAQLTITPEALP